MGKKKKFYKTSVLVDILHDGSFFAKGGPSSVQDLGAIISAHNKKSVVSFDVADEDEFTPQQMAEEVTDEGSDPKIFGIDENGDDLS